LGPHWGPHFGRFGDERIGWAQGTKIPAAAEAETGNMFLDRFANGRLRTTVELLRGEVGNDPELIKQAIAELGEPYSLNDQSHN
jgi:hypothetical protein